MTKMRSWAVIGVSLILALFCAVYPMYVIRPFRAQGAGELDAALVVLRFRALATLVFVGLAGLAAVPLWRRTVGRPARFGIGFALLLVCASAVAARINVFERMFHPIESPAFEPVSQVKLDADEKVLSVRLNGAARGYPVRAIAYHHVVNDTVGGVPIVATY